MPETTTLNYDKSMFNLNVLLKVCYSLKSF